MTDTANREESTHEYRHIEYRHSASQPCTAGGRRIVNTYAKIAALAEIRASITEHSNPVPTRSLALRAAGLVCDEQFNGFLYPMAAGHRLRAAILWARIGALVTGQPRVEAYALAAVFAHDSGNLYLAANQVIRLQQLARTEGLEIPSAVGLLKRQHAFREVLVRAHPGRDAR